MLTKHNTFKEKAGNKFYVMLWSYIFVTALITAGLPWIFSTDSLVPSFIFGATTVLPVMYLLITKKSIKRATLALAVFVVLAISLFSLILFIRILAEPGCALAACDLSR